MKRTLKVLSVLSILLVNTTYARTSDDNGGSFFGMGQDYQSADETSKSWLPDNVDLSDMNPDEIERIKQYRKEQFKKQMEKKLYNTKLHDREDNLRVNHERQLQWVYEHQLEEDDATPDRKRELYKKIREVKANEAKALKRYEINKSARDKAYADMLKKDEQDMTEEIKKIRKERTMEKLNNSSVDVGNFFEYTKSPEFQQKMKDLNSQVKKAADDPFVKNARKKLKETTTIEEEEEELTLPSRVNSLKEAEQLFSKGQKGVLLPNQPIEMAPQVREAIRQKVEQMIKANGLFGMRGFERDALNAMLFNYGIQMLPDGKVITLELINPQTPDEKPMLAPDIPVPENAQQVVIGEYGTNDDEEMLPTLDEVVASATDGSTDKNSSFSTMEQSLKEQSLNEFNLK